MTTYPRLTNHWSNRVFTFNEFGHLDRARLIYHLVPTIGVRAAPAFLYLRVSNLRLVVDGWKPRRVSLRWSRA